MQLLQIIISGISQGCIYGLIALGFVLIYKATETVNFAQGELMMLGAFCGLGLMTMLGFPFWLAVIAAIAAMAVFGIALERIVVRPILGQPAFSVVMLTIGIGYVARGLITMIPTIGTETHTLPVPYKDQAWKLGALVLNVEQMVVIADESKWVETLGDFPLPVEVTRFGFALVQQQVIKALRATGCAGDEVVLRVSGKANEPVITDGGNYILDAHAKAIPDPEKLGAALKDIAGVVEHGLFIGLSQVVIIGKAKGTEVKTL